MRNGGNIPEDVGSYFNRHTSSLIGELCIQSCKFSIFDYVLLHHNKYNAIIPILNNLSIIIHLSMAA